MTETLQRLQAAVLPRLRAFGASRALEAALAFLFAAAGSAGFAPLGPAAVAGAWLMGALPFPALFGAAAGDSADGVFLRHRRFCIEKRPCFRKQYRKQSLLRAPRGKIWRSRASGIAQPVVQFHLECRIRPILHHI